MRNPLPKLPNPTSMSQLRDFAKTPRVTAPVKVKKTRVKKVE